MKSLPNFIILVVILLHSFWAPQKIFAHETYTAGSVVFGDDFNDGNFNGWADVQGTGGWSVISGELVGFRSGQLIGGRLVNLGDWDNYSLEADVKALGGIDQGIGFRRADSLNGYELNLRYRFGANLYNTPQIILRKSQDGQVTTLASTNSVSLELYQKYHVKIEVVQEHIHVFIDSNLVFDITDTGTTVKKGAVSLAYWTGEVGVVSVWFDNVKVTTLSKKLAPVIFIPGIGGSELKTTQEVFWSAPDGHGGTFSKAYTLGEKVWVNQDEAVKLGDDDYFDILRLKPDGITSEASLALTGNLVPFGYSEIDKFFQDAGYIKGTTYFIFIYDWRKDIRESKDSLDALIETAKASSSISKVNIVAHSMGGLVARYYIADITKASKVNKLISLGVPHLGSVKELKALMYGMPLGKPILSIFNIGMSASEIKDVIQNFPTTFQLLPTPDYFIFYDNSSTEQPYPFFDHRDIDNNKETGALNFSQIKTLLTNLSYNMLVFSISEQFRSLINPFMNQDNNVKLHHIVGSGQPTPGQIKETWLINWPIKLLPKYEEIYINGDETVPLYSASLKSDKKDLSAGAKIHYVEQKHPDLVNPSGPAMQLVKNILSEVDTVPVEVKTEKIALEGQQLTVDQDANLDLFDDQEKHTGLKPEGEIETNIAETFYETTENTKHAFVKKKATKVTAKVTPKNKDTNKTNIKIRHYNQNKITKTTLYKDVPVNENTAVQFNVDPKINTSPTLSVGTSTITPTAEVEGDKVLDQTPPKSKIEVANNQAGATITITPSDTESGILKTEYSLDDGKTVLTYTQPFTITTPGKTTIQVKSIDKLGNEEIPQTLTVEISSPSPNNSFSNSNSTSTSTTAQIQPNPIATVLGIKINPPFKIAKTSSDDKVLAEQTNIDQNTNKIAVQNENPTQSVLIGTVVSVLLVLMPQIALLLNNLTTAFSFLKPSPK